MTTFPSLSSRIRQAFCAQDARNIARILAELARQGVRLVPNTRIIPGRRWPWMGENGEVIEGRCENFRDLI